MKWIVRAGFWLLPLACASAQDLAPTEGISAQWDVKTRMEAMATDVARLEDLLRRARPHEWVANGAPEVYSQQLESAKTSMHLLIAGTEKLTKQPEALQTSLEVLFGMDHMDVLLHSLQQGIRRYQGPAVADDILRFVAEHARHRDMLRQHSIDLAAARENELKVISVEARKCRMELSRKNAPETQAPPAKPAKRRTR